MRVLQLTVHFAPNIGGVETHLLDLIDGLSKKGFKVFVLCYQPLEQKAKWKWYEKRGANISILRIPWIQGLFYKFVKNPAIEFLYLVPGLFIVTPIIILVKNPDIIHAHGIVAGFVGVFWGKVFRKKIIISTHSIYHFPDNGLYHSFAKSIFSAATNVLCLSNQSIDEIARLGVPTDKIKRFTYWVDITIFRPMDKTKSRLKLNLPNSFIVLFAGRLVEVKGIRELINACTILPASFTIVIAGDGPLAKEVSEAVKKHKGKIKFVHAVANNNLAAYYNAADILIVPSTNEEGFGRVILEALACGIPVIASNKGAIPEVLDNSVGRLISISPENIANAVIAIEKDKQILQIMSKHARQLAVKRYSESNIKDIVRAYN